MNRKPARAFEARKLEVKAYCGKYAMYGCKEGKFWRSPCGQRACARPECRNMYAKKLQVRLQQLCDDNGLNRLLTLTLDPENFPDDMVAWEKISAVWAKFRQRLMRVHPHLKYAAALEKHTGRESLIAHGADLVPNDRPHIHAVVSERIGIEWIWENWKAVGGGDGGNIKKVDGPIADYMFKSLRISKYFTKDMLDVAQYVRPRQRIFWKSQGLIVRAKKSNGYGFLAKHVYGLSGKLIVDEIGSLINANIREKHGMDKVFFPREDWKEEEGRALAFVIPAPAIKKIRGFKCVDKEKDLLYNEWCNNAELVAKEPITDSKEFEHEQKKFDFDECE